MFCNRHLVDWLLKIWRYIKALLPRVLCLFFNQWPPVSHEGNSKRWNSICYDGHQHQQNKLPFHQQNLENSYDDYRAECEVGIVLLSLLNVEQRLVFGSGGGSPQCVRYLLFFFSSLSVLWKGSIKMVSSGPLMAPYSSYIAERSNGQTISKCIYFVCLSEQNK